MSLPTWDLLPLSRDLWPTPTSLLSSFVASPSYLATFGLQQFCYYRVTDPPLTRSLAHINIVTNLCDLLSVPRDSTIFGLHKHRYHPGTFPLTPASLPPLAYTIIATPGWLATPHLRPSAYTNVGHQSWTCSLHQCRHHLIAFTPAPWPLAYTNIATKVWPAPSLLQRSAYTKVANSMWFPPK